MEITAQTEIQFVEDNGKFYIMKADTPETKGKFGKFRGIATAKMSINEILALTRDA